MTMMIVSLKRSRKRLRGRFPKLKIQLEFQLEILIFRGPLMFLKQVTQCTGLPHHSPFPTGVHVKRVYVFLDASFVAKIVVRNASGSVRLLKLTGLDGSALSFRACGAVEIVA